MVTTAALPREPSRIGLRIRQALGVIGGALMVALPEVRKHAAPATAHLREHGYGILGLGFIDAAAFTHSLFTGLLVTGVSFLLFEWKVNE